MLSGSLCSFQILSLNSCISPSVFVLFVVGIKCIIFVNLSTTTRIEFYLRAKDNFIIKFVLIWVQAFSRIEFSINFPARGCV